jgi:hypothetical protein
MRLLYTAHSLTGIALSAAVLALALPSPSLAEAPVTPAVSYQGHLEKNGAAYDGVADLRFRLFDAENAGVQIGTDLNFAGVAIDDGLFDVALDFGVNAFNGNARWLEIAAKTTGDANLITLTPRQAMRPAPYSVYSLGGATTGGPWNQDGAGILYPGGGAGVTGSSPFSHGKGVFLDGGWGTGAHLYAYDYDTSQPLTLHLNYPGGRVGVGAEFPDAKFQVNSASEAAIIGKHLGNWVGVYGESATSAGVWGNSLTGIGVQGSTGGTSICGVYGYATNASSYGGIFRNTAGGAALWADGLAYVKTLQILGGADIVEGFDTGERALEPGTVVVIDEHRPGDLRASDSAYDHRVAGVVSGAGGIEPGLKLGQEGKLDGDTPVAMSGRVYVRCSAENGAIRPGDLLTTAGSEGHAMRSSDPARANGAVIGKAMSTLDRGTGLVLVLVNLQ